MNTLPARSAASNSPQTIPTLSGESGLQFYLQEIKKFPVLEAAEEQRLARLWREQGDREAVQILVTSHLRLVAKLAMNYRGYGLPISDLIAEGNLGMMHAVKKFEPDKGHRFSTYAMWWIKAAIQEYILKSWSLVKIGTTAAQKKLFFNLQRLKKNIAAADDMELSPAQVKHIATELVVPEHEVISMNRRLQGRDGSLNAPLTIDGDGEVQDMLADTGASQEEFVAGKQERTQRAALFKEALKALNPREAHILAERRLREPPSTLEDLSQHYGISRERVRQIENRAFEKLQANVLQLLGDETSKRKALPAK